MNIPFLYVSCSDGSRHILNDAVINVVPYTRLLNVSHGYEGSVWADKRTEELPVDVFIEYCGPTRFFITFQNVPSPKLLEQGFWCFGKKFIITSSNNGVATAEGRE